MKILTVYTLNSLLLTFKAHNHKLYVFCRPLNYLKNSEYDKEIPQSQTADNPVAPRGTAAQPSRDTRKTN